MDQYLITKAPVHSTDEASEKDRLDYWIDLICDEFVQLDCSISEHKNFKGRLCGWDLDDVRVSEVSGEAQHVTRSKKQIAKAREREFLLSLQMDYTGILSQDGRVARLQPGDFVIYDSARPYFLHFDQPFRHVVLQIPYDSLAEHFLQPENITARTVSAQTAVGALASQFIQSVACRVDTLAPQERHVINQHLIELIVLAMSSTASLREADGQSIARTAMLERIKQYIETNIRHPQLSPGLVARHHRISERYQRMLFASTGTTISRFILDRRLELCREMLESPELSDYSISQVAFSNGFNDASGFSRKFKEHYDVTPKEYRAMKIQATSKN
ncbi:MAG: helix-turn-helix domain-containing protein [Gammaproteobacteria bacterium]|nr:helix-turn-helix domain-containing protein [Gammaproteobacteria bacterium]MCY4210163.1 helix-turn-helix domain-containing protein [Gammaproteobacteria bacterium]MCY4283026.1 helix-turn-helix domain-containing protein [Gammaproteobacteria bacterium]MCY4337929.1 helix-turn-helix domain-containing protein [Gammaproteobacteria bacterium]